MKSIYKIVFPLVICLLFLSCSVENSMPINQNTVSENYKYLALGDSYTIGQSVCETCRFPVQLKDSIGKYLNTNDTFHVQIIATTGWTTTNLKSAITKR